MSSYVDHCIALSERDYEDINDPSCPLRKKLASIYLDPSEKGGRRFPESIWKQKVIPGDVIGRAIYFATDIIRDIPGMKSVSISDDPSWFNEDMSELKRTIRTSISLLRTEVLELNSKSITVRYGVFGFRNQKRWGPYVDYTLIRGDETQTPNMPALEWASLWAV